MGSQVQAPPDVALAIAQGGPVTLIYGPIIMFVLVGACAASLAELASVYPTAYTYLAF